MVQDAYAQVDELYDLLVAELRACRQACCQYAENEAEYRKSLRLAILDERQRGTPVTIIGDLCRGREDIAELKASRDRSEALYKASQEAINVYKLRMRMLNDEIGRVWHSGDPNGQ